MASHRRGRPRPTALLVRVNTLAKRSTSSGVGSNDSVGTRAKRTLACSARRSPRRRTTTAATMPATTTAATTTVLTATANHERAPSAHCRCLVSPTTCVRRSYRSGVAHHHLRPYQNPHELQPVCAHLSSHSQTAHMTGDLVVCSGGARWRQNVVRRRARRRHEGVSPVCRPPSRRRHRSGAGRRFDRSSAPPRGPSRTALW